jgi:hypothetical protein
MTRFIKANTPALVAAMVFILTLGYFTQESLQMCAHHLGYAMDDAYISMSVGKNLALHGLWGMTSHGFDSPASSLIWPALIGLFYFLFGVHEITPFLIELVLGLGLIFSVAWIFKRSGVPSAASLVALTLMVFLAPLPLLVFVGLEHILHALVSVVFLYCATRCLVQSTAPTRGEILRLCGLAALLIATRYEGAALVCFISLGFGLRRRFQPGLMILAAGVLPVVLFGCVAVSQGCRFLPNSILLKANLPQAGAHTLVTLYNQTVGPAIWQFLQYPFILLLTLLSGEVLIAAWLLAKAHPALPAGAQGAAGETDAWLGRLGPVIILNLAFIFMTFAHCLFAKIGWFFRYEAYLIVTGLVVLTISGVELLALAPRKPGPIRRLPPVMYACVLLALLPVWPLFARSHKALSATARATANIYEQQYQMALFLKKHYYGQAVAVNDIGAVSFLADIKLVDLFGLASREVLALKQKNQLDDREIYRLCKDANVKIALVYDSWFARLPAEWIKAGEWSIPHNVVCGGDKVSIYAVDPAEAEALVKNLREFSPGLPKEAVWVVPATARKPGP